MRLPFRSKVPRKPSKPFPATALGSTPTAVTICAMCGTQQEFEAKKCIKCGVPFTWRWRGPRS